MKQKCYRIFISPKLAIQVKDKLEANGLDYTFFSRFMDTRPTWIDQFLFGTMKRTTKLNYERIMVFLAAENIKELPLCDLRIYKPKKQKTTKPLKQQIMPRIWAEQSALVSKYLGRKKGIIN